MAPSITTTTTAATAQQLLCLLFTAITAAAALSTAGNITSTTSTSDGGDSTASSAVARTGCYSALFSFGTSLSDTGNGGRASPAFFGSLKPPYGSSYFGQPFGRFCDGRLFVDLLAQAVGLPLLNPYLAIKDREKGKGDGVVDFSRGINYATSGATAQDPSFYFQHGAITFLTLNSFDVQLRWHSGILDMIEGRTPNTNPDLLLPSPEVLANALYFIEIGGNDYGKAFLSRHLFPPARTLPITFEDVAYAIPSVVSKTLAGIQALYLTGARNFFLYGVIPEGCNPLALRFLNGSKDITGCLSVLNEVNRIHNSRYLQGVQALRAKYPDIHITFADTYSAYNDVLQNPSSHGFNEILQACCGAGLTKPYGFDLRILCGVKSYKCLDPTKYIIWDGPHLTEAFNRYLFNTFIRGQHVYPSNGLSSCASYV